MRKLVIILAMMMVVTGVFADNELKKRVTSCTGIFLLKSTDTYKSLGVDYYVQLVTDTDCYNIYCVDLSEAVLVFNRCSYPYEIKDWALNEFLTSYTTDYLVLHKYVTKKTYDKLMSPLKKNN